MMTDELLNYDYKKIRKTNPVLKAAALLFVAAFIFVMLPLLNQAGIGGQAFIATASAPAATACADDLTDADAFAN